ncbi:MAG: HipA domain-containing protein, partial [Candidatus Tenebribacter davisii]|nr:HipA domain-containing protein [Candidatus Tenebribacter davisii]
RAHFMTQRFDRENGNTRHHIQTLCAMQHFNYNQVTIYSYEQLFQTMRKLRLPYNDAVQMFRRMVFNVVASNCDDHTKNFAFRLRENSRWELSPAYDICYAFDPKSIWVSQHALSINGKRKGISYDDLLNIAKSMNIKKAKQIIEDIRSNVAKWRDFADEFKVRSEFRDLIYNNLVLKI